MPELITGAAALGAGLLTGTVFFGGLWWTVRRSIVSAWPGAWFLCSLLLRTALALGGFYCVGRAADWRYLVVCLVGFIGARFVVEWFTQLPAAPVAERAEGGDR
jgi:F1F0 ATPase subunit 2